MSTVVPFPLPPRACVEVFGKPAEVFRQRGLVVDVICQDAFGRPFNTAVRIERVKFHHDERWEQAVSIMHGSYTDKPCDSGDAA